MSRTLWQRKLILLFAMSQTPVPDAPIRAHIDAKRLNGTVWGLLLLAALAVAVTSGSYVALIPLMFLLPNNRCGSGR